MPNIIQFSNGQTGKTKVYFENRVTFVSSFLWSSPFILCLFLAFFTNLSVILFIFLAIVFTVVVIGNALTNDPVQNEYGYSTDEGFYRSNLYAILTTNPIFVGIQWLKTPRK